MSPLFRRKKNKQTQPAENTSAAAVQTAVQNSGENIRDNESGSTVKQFADLNQSSSTANKNIRDTAAQSGGSDMSSETGKARNSENMRVENGSEEKNRDGKSEKPVRTPGQSSVKQKTPEQNQEELAAAAYTAWVQALQEQTAAEAAAKTTARYFGQIDITRAHPTGAAQFYAHMETRLSSLIREPKAYARAKEKLAQLRELTRNIAEEHGFAPISLAAGRLSWTELPQLDPQEIPEWTGETYDATGELRLDFPQFQQGVSGAGAESAQQKQDTVINAADSSAADFADQKSTEKSTVGTAAPAAETADGQTQPNDIDKEYPAAESETVPANQQAENLQKLNSQSAAKIEPQNKTPIRTATERTVPAMLRGIRVEFLPDGDAKLKLSTQAAINPEVIHALRLGGIDPECVAKLREIAQRSAGIDEPLAQLAALARAFLPGFKLENQNIIGCFHTPSKVMLSDLEAMEPYIKNSGIAAALAGDQKLRKITGAPIPPGMKADRLPEVERGAGDLDPAELDVVEAVASGRSIVIDAPAGSRRTETLASIMADAAASGKSLIFIPSRGSSAAAVKTELENIGLGDMVLDFSDMESVPQRIRTGLRLPKPEVNAEVVAEQREELSRTRRQLTNFVAELHTVNPDWGVSVSDLLVKLAHLTASDQAPRTRIRFRSAALAAIKAAGKDEVIADLHRGAELGIFDRETEISAWANCKITDHEAAAGAIERARRIHETILPAVRSQAARAAGETGLYQAQTPAQWFEQIEMFEGISHSLDYFLPQIFETSAVNLIAVTATKEWRAKNGFNLSHSEKRMYRRDLTDMLRPGAVPSDVHSELVKVEEQREIWKRYTKDAGWPTLPSGMTQIHDSRKLLTAELSALAAEVGAHDYFALSFEQINVLTAALVADAPHMETLPERNLMLEKIRLLGIESFGEDLRVRGVAREAIEAEFSLAFTSSVFEQLLRKSKLLAALGPRDISALLAQFRTLDENHVNSLAGPVQLAAINNMRTYARAHRNETLRLDQLLAKYGVGVLRDVIATYPRLVQLARPIWIVPPILALDYIPQMRWVDLVLCDTTERTELAAVISTLLRGRQLVIAGDRRRNEIVNTGERLASRNKIRKIGEVSDSSDGNPQRSLSENTVKTAAEAGESGDDKTAAVKNPDFAVSGNIEFAELGSAGAFQSFAEIFPVLELPTLRAQHDEISSRALIAHGYEDVFAPIPACPQKNAAQLIVVDGRGVPSARGDGAIEAPQAEVDAVVDVILNYALDRNPDSLAVITISDLHARQIRKALHNAKASSVILERFMKQNTAEPFVVANISQAYGLRRDHVILSPGFGKTVHGRVLHSFGQLQESRGFLDLVDSLEAARKSMTVVSSLGVGEIDIARVVTPGPKLLAQVISAAGNSVNNASNVQTYTDNPLLADLGERLREQGFAVGYNYGFAGSRKLPLVVGKAGVNPDWELAVLIDDAEYVKEESLRRRDRFFPTAVAERGWIVYQTLSTSLFIDPAGQAAEIAEKLQALHGAASETNLVPPILDGEYWVEEPLSRNSQNSAHVGDNGFHSSLPAVNSPEGTPDRPGTSEAAHERTMRPIFTPGLQLSAYTDDQLDDVLAWIASDRIPRSESQLIADLRAELGILRQGAQIDAVLRNVVRRSGLAK